MLKLVQDILLLTAPTILGYLKKLKLFGNVFLVYLIFSLFNRFLIDFIADKRQSAYMGYFYAITLFFMSTLQTLFLQHYFYRMFIVSARIRTALMNMIYKKSLVLSTLARRELNAGQMNNLMTNDSQLFLNLTMYINLLWSAPLQITVALVLLWRQIGISSLVGFAAIMLFIPLNIYITKKLQELRQAKLKLTDSRIKTTNEVLSGIKVIKLYGWETSFESMISGVRDKELKLLQKNAYFRVASGLIV